MVDEANGRVEALDERQTARVMDGCFQCKLCEVQCPYTPRDGHEFQLDFPKLVHRYKAVKARRDGGDTLHALTLGNPDLTVKLARASFGLANVMNRVGLHRLFMEKVLGIHRDKLLPDFAGRTFEAWATREGLVGAPGGEAVLFPTCYVQNNEPQIGVDTVEVMRRNGVDLRCTRGLACCGMPAWETGDLEALRARARRNLDVLEPWVAAGAKVLAVNPTCSMMLRRELPELVAAADRPRARALAAVVQDPSEFLWNIRKEPRFSTAFSSSPGSKVAYHAPCHLRAQAVGFRGKSLIQKVAGVEEVTTVMECCGHDGTHAMKVEHFEASGRVGKKAFDGMATDADVWATECPLAAIQFQQFTGKKPLHPMSLLARAYRGESFDDAAARGPVTPIASVPAREQETP
jgi:Fe-S oxidoreductase